MKCVLCRSEKEDFKSVEHIIPTNMGNQNLSDKLILQKGYICDKCNNTTLSRIDKNFTKLNEINQLISSLFIPNREGKLKDVPFIINGKQSVMKQTPNSIKFIMPENINLINGQAYTFDFQYNFINENKLKKDKAVSMFLSKLTLELFIKNVLMFYNNECEFIRDSLPFNMEIIRQYLCGHFSNFIIPYKIEKITNISPFANKKGRNIRIEYIPQQENDLFQFDYAGLRFSWNTSEIIKGFLHYSKKTKKKILIQDNKGKVLYKNY